MRVHIWFRFRILIYHVHIARLYLFGALSGDILCNLLLYFHASQEEVLSLLKECGYL